MILEIILEFLAGIKQLEEPVFIIAWHQKASYRLGTVFLNTVFLDAQPSLCRKSSLTKILLLLRGLPQTEI